MGREGGRLNSRLSPSLAAWEFHYGSAFSRYHKCIIVIMLSALLFFFELYHRFIFSLNAVLSELLFLAMKFSFVIYPSLFSETYLSYYASIEVYLIPFRLVSLMSFPFSSMLTSFPIRLRFIFPFLFSLSLYLGRLPSFFLLSPFSFIETISFSLC